MDDWEKHLNICPTCAVASLGSAWWCEAGKVIRKNRDAYLPLIWSPE